MPLKAARKQSSTMKYYVDVEMVAEAEEQLWSHIHGHLERFRGKEFSQAAPASWAVRRTTCQEFQSNH